jgi:hypothetical protein
MPPLVRRSSYQMRIAMGGRPKKRTELSESEIACFLEAATAPHKACCAPLIAPWGDHGHALTDVNQALCAAIRTITGKEAEWVRRSSTGPAGSIPSDATQRWAPSRCLVGSA